MLRKEKNVKEGNKKGQGRRNLICAGPEKPRKGSMSRMF